MFLIHMNLNIQYKIKKGCTIEENYKKIIPWLVFINIRTVHPTSKVQIKSK